MEEGTTLEPTTIEAITQLYSVVSHLKIKVHPVPQQAFHEFWKSVSKLIHVLENDRDDPFWQSVMRSLRKYRFVLGAMPANFSSVELWDPGEFDSLVRKLEQASQFYPGMESVVSATMEALRRVCGLPENPLLANLVRLADDWSLADKIAIVVKEPRLIPQTTSFVRPVLPNARIIYPRSLKSFATVYKSIIIFGRPQWYPDYVFRAPRAPNIHIITYEWLATGVVLPHLFDQEAKADVLTTIPTFRWDTEIPSRDWESVAINKQIHPQEVMERFDVVEAKLFELADGSTVFLEKDGTILTVDLSADTNAVSLDRVSVADVEMGNIIILRKAGSGDHIAPIAEEILGPDRYARIRESQLAWKRPLAHLLSSSGVGTVVEELRRRGGIGANEHTVRYWVALRSIHPQRREDFAAIANLVNLKGGPESYWANAVSLERAHKQAGFKLRRMLLEHLGKVDLSPLLEHGYMDLTLPDSGWGNLGAFVVEDIAPSAYKIPGSEVGQLQTDGLRGAI